MGDWWRWLGGRPRALRHALAADRLAAARVGLVLILAGAGLVAASFVPAVAGPAGARAGLLLAIGLVSLVIDTATATRSRPGHHADDLAWRVEPAGAADREPPGPMPPVTARDRPPALPAGLEPAPPSPAPHCRGRPA